MSSLERNGKESPKSADRQAEIERLREEYSALDERHRTLDACSRVSDECQGLFFEMARLEKSMKVIRKRLQELTVQDKQVV